MLLEFATFLLVLQVFGEHALVRTIPDEERERYLLTEPRICPICGANLHGHGWRDRCANVLNASLLILMHRKRCPQCRMTFTLLPKGLHFMKNFDVLSIAGAIRSFLETGSHATSIPIARSVRECWLRTFLKRNSQGEAKTRESLLEILEKNQDAFLAAPLALIKLARDEIVSRQSLERFRVPHHRLFLGISSSPG